MATPIIHSVGATSGAGTPGEGRNDLVPGEQVDLSDSEPTNAGAVYFWEFEDVPIGTAPSLVGAATATPHFVVDPDVTKTGTYRVKCTVNGLDSSTEILAAPLPATGGRIPSFQETLHDDSAGNAKGWHKGLTEFMRGASSRLKDPGPGKAGNELVQSVWGGGRETHNSDTALIVGAFALNPNDFALENTTVAFEFEVIAANGSSPLTTHVKIRNLTDAEDVTSSVIDIIDSTTPTKYSAALAVGPGVGKIKTSGEKIYEVRIYLDAAPGDPDLETIELYKAEVRAIFTVVELP